MFAATEWYTVAQYGKNVQNKGMIRLRGSFVLLCKMEGKMFNIFFVELFVGYVIFIGIFKIAFIILVYMLTLHSLDLLFESTFVESAVIQLHFEVNSLKRHENGVYW